MEGGGSLGHNLFASPALRKDMFVWLQHTSMVAAPCPNTPASPMTQAGQIVQPIGAPRGGGVLGPVPVVLALGGSGPAPAIPV
jgi:hypothetical protein